ncbi:hypothetical protein N752_19240 [Desulforamulus aquiferis]|nr:hypothetical protein N752_19240 [Desulforamulus aquiferis]
MDGIFIKTLPKKLWIVNITSIWYTINRQYCLFMLYRARGLFDDLY